MAYKNVKRFLAAKIAAAIKKGDSGNAWMYAARLNAIEHGSTPD